MPSGKLADQRRELLPHQLAGAPRVAVALEGDDDLGDAGLQSGGHAPHAGKSEHRLLDRLRDGELDLRGRSPGTLDQELQRRQRQVGKEVAAQTAVDHHSDDAEDQRESDDPSPQRQDAPEPAKEDRRPATLCIHQVLVVLCAQCACCSPPPMRFIQRGRKR